MQLAADAQLGWPLPEELDDAALERLLYPSPSVKGKKVRTYVEPDYATVHQELKKKGVTLTLLWEEYKQSAGQAGYQYTAFCVRYAAWAAKLKRSMRQVHRAAEKLFVSTQAELPLPDHANVRGPDYYH